MASVGLVAACDDPRALAFALWPRQREILAAVEAGPRIQILALLAPVCATNGQVGGFLYTHLVPALKWSERPVLYIGASLAEFTAVK